MGGRLGEAGGEVRFFRHAEFRNLLPHSEVGRQTRDRRAGRRIGTFGQNDRNMMTDTSRSDGKNGRVKGT